MSLSAALLQRVTSTPTRGSAASTTVSAAFEQQQGKATAGQASAPAEAKLHFFPLPAPPRWRRIAVTGASLPACAGGTLSALNQAHTLLLYGGVRGQTPMAALPPWSRSALGVGGSASGGANTAALASSLSAPGSGGPLPLQLQATSNLSADMYVIDVGTGRCAGMGPRSAAMGVLNGGQDGAGGTAAGAGANGAANEAAHTARVGHAAIPLDAHTLYVSGGWNGRRYVTSGLLVDLRHKQLLFEALTTATSNGAGGKLQLQPRVLPPPRRDHALVSVGSGRHKRLYLIGGFQGEENLADVWVCRLVRPPKLPAVVGADATTAAPTKRGPAQWTWSPFVLAPGSSRPSPRRGHSCAVVGHKIWLFGGATGYSSFQNDVHVLDTRTRTWTSYPSLAFAGTTPAPRAWHSCVAVGGDPSAASSSSSSSSSESSGYLLLFGGAGPCATFLNDLHLLDTKAMRWYALVQSSEQTEARIDAAMANGGSGGAAAIAKLPPPDDMPGPRASHSACMIGSRLYIHGGFVPVSVHSSSEVQTQVRPCFELFELDTFLPPEVLNPSLVAPVPGTRADEDEDDERHDSEDDSSDDDDDEDDEEDAEGDECGGSTGRKDGKDGGGAGGAAAKVTTTGTSAPTKLASVAEDDDAAAAAVAAATAAAAEASAQQQSQSGSPSKKHPGIPDVQATEGWLALSSSSTLPTNPIASAPTRGGAPTPSQWSRRFVRLEKHSLLAYHPEPRAATASGPNTGAVTGVMPVERDGLVKLWTDVAASVGVADGHRGGAGVAGGLTGAGGGVSGASGVLGTGAADTLDWMVAEAGLAGLTSMALIPSAGGVGGGGGGTNCGAGEGVAVAQLHGQLLGRLLSEPGDTRYTAFLTYLKGKKQGHLLTFCTEAERFRTGMERVENAPRAGAPGAPSSWEREALRAAARAIWDNYLATSNASAAVALPAPLFAEVKATLQRLGLASGTAAPLPSTGVGVTPTLPSNLFQPALLHVQALLRNMWMPKYLTHLASVPTTPKDTPASSVTGSAAAGGGLGGSAGASAAASSSSTASIGATPSPAPSVAVSPHAGGFRLKTSLSDSDRNEPCCAHCLVKFTSKTTKHRLFCAYCHGVFCDRCTQNLIALPTELQRMLVGGTVTRIRVCDPCEHVLAARKKADATRSGGGGASGMMIDSSGGGSAGVGVAGGASDKSKRLWAFSYTSRRTHQPIHLASENRANTLEWVAALTNATHAAAAAASSSTGAGSCIVSAVMGSSSDGSPGKGARETSANAAAAGGGGESIDGSSASSSSVSCDREGWLMAEENSSKIWKRCYCVLRGGTLQFFDLQLRKTFSLRVDSVLAHEQVAPLRNDGAAAVAARGAAAAAALKSSGIAAAAAAATEQSDPSLWPSLYTFSITNKEGDNDPAGAANTAAIAAAAAAASAPSPTNNSGNSGADSSGNNRIVFAAATSEEREHWVHQLRADVHGLRVSAGLSVGGSGAGASGAAGGGGSGSFASTAPGASKHPRVRSVSTPFVHAAASGSSGGGGGTESGAMAAPLEEVPSHRKGPSGAALALLSSLAAAASHQRK